jgi:hypothetical protein
MRVLYDYINFIKFHKVILVSLKYHDAIFTGGMQAKWCLCDTIYHRRHIKEEENLKTNCLFWKVTCYTGFHHFQPQGPFGSSGFKTGACQIDPFSKSGDFETGRIDHSGFEIGEVVQLPPGFKTGVTPSFSSLIWLAEFQYLRYGCQAQTPRARHHPQ